MLPLVVAAVAAVALVAGGCTSGDRPAPAGAATGPTGAGPRPRWSTVTPGDGATRVGLDTRARVVADAGRLRAVGSPGLLWAERLAGTPGRRRPHLGRLAPWAPATRYRVAAEAVNDAGTPTRTRTSFTTLRPRAELRAAIMPLDGETVGVGLPIGVWFVLRRWPTGAAVERRLQVTSSKPVTGAWRWFADNEVHYRPSYWPSGTRVTLAHRLAADAGRGVWVWPTGRSASASASAGSASSTSGPTA